MTLTLEPFEGTCPVLVRDYGAWHPLSQSELAYADQPVDGNVGLVARIGSEVVGAATARTWPATTHQDEWAAGQLAVAPHHRRRGVGAALLDGLLTMGLPELRFLEVDPDTARPLLTSRGFQPIDFGDAHYLHDVARAPLPGGEFLHVPTAPGALADQVAELGRQYNADTSMPDDFEVFAGLADPAHGFLTLGVEDGTVWGVGVTVALVAPGWGSSQRLFVHQAHRGRRRSVQLKLAQLDGARTRGWDWVYCGSPAPDHPASRANASAGGRPVEQTRWALTL